jgi:hypothetical protein
MRWILKVIQNFFCQGCSDTKLWQDRVESQLALIAAQQQRIIAGFRTSPAVDRELAELKAALKAVDDMVPDHQ